MTNNKKDIGKKPVTAARGGSFIKDPKTGELTCTREPTSTFAKKKAQSTPITQAEK